jgi:transcriptional regulator with XRE-family HTH domain
VPQEPKLSNQPTLGDIVRRHRLRKGWNQNELVIKMGGLIDQGQLSRMEGNTLKTPRLPVLRKLGEVFEVPAGQLLKASRFPGAPILSPSLDEALVDLPQEKFPIVEQFVRFITLDGFNPAALTKADRDTINNFLREVERALAQDRSK